MLCPSLGAVLHSVPEGSWATLSCFGRHGGKGNAYEGKSACIHHIYLFRSMFMQMHIPTLHHKHTPRHTGKCVRMLSHAFTDIHKCTHIQVQTHISPSYNSNGSLANLWHCWKVASRRLDWVGGPVLQVSHTKVKSYWAGVGLRTWQFWEDKKLPHLSWAQELGREGSSEPGFGTGWLWEVGEWELSCSVTARDG